MIRITFLGTRGLVEEQNEAHKHHTAYIIEDEKQRVLFDFGETWAQEPLPNVDAIWISHAHPDHIGGLDGRVVDIPIFCSAVTKSLFPEGLKANDVHIVEHKREFDLLRWRALPFPVTHSIRAPATGLRLVVDGQVIVLPSDVLYFENADDLMKDAILYIADGSTLEKSLVRKHKETGELFGHAALRQQLRWCQKYRVPLLFAIHYGKEPIEMTDPVLARWLQQTQEAVAPDVAAHIAWDGKVVEIEGNRVRWRRKRGEWVEETLADTARKKIEIPEIRVSLLPRGIPAKARGVADAFGIAEHPEHTLVKPTTVRIESGDRVLIVGHSGSGKSLLLARLAKELKAATPQFQENKPCVDHFKNLNLNEALALFARCGLSDVYFILRTPAELSDGQRARFALATLLASNADFVAVDRFLEDLDEDCKRVVGYLFAREIKERGKVLLAATHTEPPGFPWTVRVTMREFQKPDIEMQRDVPIKKPRFDVELRAAKLGEIQPLLSWHYRGGQPVATRFAFAAYIRENLVGAVIFAHPLNPIRAMLRLFPELDHQREVVVCSRVVVHPNYRSIGISTQLLRFAVKQAFDKGIKVVYSLSRMALLIPLFKAAGWESLRLSLDSKKRAEARKYLTELGYKPYFTLGEFERWLKGLPPSQRKRLKQVADEVYPFKNASLFLRCRIPFTTTVDFSFASRVRPNKEVLEQLRNEQPDFSFEKPRLRKLAVNVIVENLRTEETLIKDISRYDPGKLSDAVLQDDWRIVIAWWARLRRGGKFKYNREQVLDLATKIFNELVKRDKVTFHWEGLTDAGKDLLRECLKRTVKQGLYLVPPHGELIAKGEKTAMVKSRAFKLRGFYLLCSGSLCYGWVRFKSRYDSNEYPKRISVKEFKELQHAHCISDEERKAWWGSKGWLYYYPIREFIPLPKPRRFRLPQGVQTFIREVEFLQKFDIKQITPAALREMTTNELVLLHAELHRAFWATYRKGAVEPIVNAHAWVVDEMRRRGMDTRPVDLLDAMSRRFELLARKIYLREVLTYFPQRIVLNDREVSLVGSLAIAGRGNDIDLLFAGKPDRVREFRIAMLFPPNLRQRLHFVYDEEGPFTNYIPLYRKVLERIDPIRIVPMQREPEAEFKVTLMKPFPLMKASAGYHIGEFFDRDSLWRLWAEPHIREAGYIYIEPKYDGIRMCIHKKGNKVAIYTEDAKRDRAHIFPEAVEEIRRLPQDELILDAEFVWWKEGAPIPRQKMMHFVVGKEPLRGEEIHINVFDVLWADGKSLQFLPFAKRKRILQRILPRDKKFLKPVPSKKVRNRKEFDKALDWATTFIGSEGAMLKDPRGLYDAKRTTSWAKLKNVKEAKFIIIGRRKVPAGRPAGVKWTEEEAFKNLPSLLKKSRTWIYRVAFLSRDGKTLIPMEERKKLTDKDLTLRWNEEKQRWEGFDDPKLWEMGLGFKDRKPGEYAYANTYASALEPPPKIGDIITVTPIAIDKWKGDDGKEHYSWMFPIVREADPTRDKPDDQDFIDHLVEVSRGQFKRKKAEQEAIEKLKALTVTEEFEAFLKWAAAWDAPSEDEELARIVKMPELDEKRRKLIEKWASLTIDELHEIDPRKLPRFFYVIQHHFRGKSVHKDFRVKVDDHLEGFTITDQVKGYIKETVDNIQEAKRYTLDPKAERLHPEMDPADHCFAVEKAQQPLVWLTVVKDVFLPGTVGATRFNEGVFYGRDWGLLWLGTRKPYFIEFFLRGKNFKGTLVFRKLPARPEWEKVPKEGLHWECWFTRKDTPPYLLTERARRRKDYVPPDGISGLPPEFEALIEKERPDLVWWKGKLTAAEKLAKIDRAYNWLIENQYLKGPKVEVSQETQAKTAQFTFLRIWWKGQTVIRAMPQERFFLLLKNGGFRVWELDANPLWEAAQSVLETEMPEPPPNHKEITDWMKFEGDLPPEHALNPTKRLTAHAEIIDTGAARLIEDTEHFVHIDFRGKNFKGRWVLKREEPDSAIFTFEPAVGPGQALEEDEGDGYRLDETETAAESPAAVDS